MAENINKFEPKIIGFLCNWCSYEASDAAGKASKEYAANIRIIKLMCSGRVDPAFVIDAFKEGADGVLILGCHPGDCHYKEGNNMALRRYMLLKKVLRDFGIEEARLKLEWVSAREADKFVRVVNEMTETLRALGPFKRSKK